MSHDDPLNARADQVIESANRYLQALISQDTERMDAAGREWRETAVFAEKEIEKEDLSSGSCKKHC